jgi:metal-responsive CopG/Arc/MetJ family transcriptional regulator
LSPSDYTTVSIPKILYEKVQQRIEGTGFTSVSRFVVYILRELVTESKKEKAPFSDKDKKQLLEKLEKLGYT